MAADSNTLSRATCLSQAINPTTELRSTSYCGHYWRNCRTKQFRQRFERDPPPPEFGYVYKPGLWRWDEDGLSVNLCSCTCTRCSIVLQGDEENCCDVVQIDLERLSEFVGRRFLAMYEPLEEADEENPCHFVLLPEEGSMEDARLAVEDAFSNRGGIGAKKVPRDNASLERARKQQAEVESVFMMHRDVFSQHA